MATSSRISIILPVYNRAHTLSDCVRSVLNQTYQNFEIILIDDGSTDATPSLCARFAEGDPRFMLLYGEHAGVSAARNKGLEAASGEYIFFLDSDDAIHPCLLDTLLRAMTQTGADIAGVPLYFINDECWSAELQKHTALPYEQAAAFPQDSEGTLRLFFRGNTPLNTIGGVMMRRELIGQTRFRTDLTISEDYFFIYENVLKNAPSVIIDQKWYFCRMHATNSSNDYSFEGFLSRFRRRQMVWQSEDAFGRSDNAKQEKLNAFFVYLRCLQNQPQRSERRKMSAVMKQNRKEILPALRLVNKLRFWLYVYVPFTHRIACTLRKPRS